MNSNHIFLRSIAVDVKKIPICEVHKTEMVAVSVEFAFNMKRTRYACKECVKGFGPSP